MRNLILFRGNYLAAHIYYQILIEALSQAGRRNIIAAQERSIKKQTKSPKVIFSGGI